MNKKRKEATVMTDAAEKYFNKLYPNGEFKLASTDPEFADFFANFSGDEVVNQDDLDDRTRMMAALPRFSDARASMSSGRSFREH